MALDTNSTIVGTGSNQNIECQVDSTFSALRTSVRPLEYAGGGGILGGHFGLSTNTGSIASAAAGGVLFSARWAETRMIMVLKRLTVSGVCTAFTAVAQPDLELVKINSYTSAPAGGTSIIPATFSNKCRLTMASSLFSNEGTMMVSSTGVLTAGSQNLDTYGVASSPIGPFTAVSAQMNPTDLYREVNNGQHGLVFGVNEGFSIRTPTGWAASTVTLRLYFTMEWAEVPQY